MWKGEKAAFRSIIIKGMVFAVIWDTQDIAVSDIYTKQ